MKAHFPVDSDDLMNTDGKEMYLLCKLYGLVSCFLRQSGLLRAGSSAYMQVASSFFMEPIG